MITAATSIKPKKRAFLRRPENETRVTTKSSPPMIKTGTKLPNRENNFRETLPMGTRKTSSASLLDKISKPTDTATLQLAKPDPIVQKVCELVHDAFTRLGIDTTRPINSTTQLPKCSKKFMLNDKDSLDLIDVIADVVEHFKLPYPSEGRIPKIQTVEDLIRYIKENT